MASIKTRVHCIALCTGYGENTSVSWTFFTHHIGFETQEVALRSFAAEIVERYRARGFRIATDDGVQETDKFDPTMFIAFVNSLLRGSWGDYGDPDKVGETVTRWWPFTDVADIFDYKKSEIVTIQMLGAEVILAAVDKSLLTDFDASEIVDNMPKIAETLGVEAKEEITLAAIGMA